MTAKKNFRWLAGGTTVLLAVLLCGCAGDVAEQDAADRVEPMMRRAASRERARDLDGAIEIYEQIVRETPSVALAHLHLGILLDDYRQDYIGAIYHYREYLRRRETTEKREMIEERLVKAELKLEAQYAARPGGSGSAEEALREKIAELNSQSQRLTQERRAATARATALEAELERLRRRLRLAEHTTAVPVGDGGSRLRELSSNESVVRTYKVVAGDSLTEIARKCYEDAGQWRRIYEANKETIPDPSRLQLGQVLVIP